MATVKFSQNNGSALLVSPAQNHLEVVPESGTLFTEILSDGRRIDAVSLAGPFGFLALVGYQINGAEKTHTRVDLWGKVLDVPYDDVELHQVFIDQVKNINACLKACADFVNNAKLSGGSQPKLIP